MKQADRSVTLQDWCWETRLSTRDQSVRLKLFLPSTSVEGDASSASELVAARRGVSVRVSEQSEGLAKSSSCRGCYMCLCESSAC